MKQQISPSILISDFLNLGDSIDMLNRSDADLIHLDIMDGVFVPNMTIGFPVISQIKSAAKKPLDVHLMIVDPDRHIERFREVGADILTVHHEACKDLASTLKKIRSLGMKASASIKPETSVKVLQPYLDLLDMVLIMTVEPGYGGQAFLENSYERVSELKEYIRNAGSNTLIEVDGGVGMHNFKKLREAGADVFVIGAAIFTSADPFKMISEFKHL